jgi:hypothetical protein
VTQLQQTSEPAIADAVADVANAAQRIVEERVELLRLEVRNDMRRIIRASALGASGVVALGVAVGMAAGAVTWTLALWIPFGPALGITAVITGVVGVILSRMARTRLPGGSSAQDSVESSVESRSSEDGGRKALSGRRHEPRQVEARTT